MTLHGQLFAPGPYYFQISCHMQCTKCTHRTAPENYPYPNILVFLSNTSLKTLWKTNSSSFLSKPASNHVFLNRISLPFFLLQFGAGKCHFFAVMLGLYSYESMINDWWILAFVAVICCCSCGPVEVINFYLLWKFYCLGLVYVMVSLSGVVGVFNSVVWGFDLVVRV